MRDPGPLSLFWVSPDLVHERLIEQAGPLSLGLFGVLFLAVAALLLFVH